MSYRMFSLHQLGWRPAYARGLTLADFEAGYPGRVVSVLGAGLVVASSQGEVEVALPGVEADIVLGDWVLLSHETGRVIRRLARPSSMAFASEEDGEACPSMVRVAVE